MWDLTHTKNINKKQDKDLFLIFQNEREKSEDLLDCLLEKNRLMIQTTQGELTATLLHIAGKPYATNPYGKEYHIVLEGSKGTRYPAHIEHRINMKQEITSQSIYPSSRRVDIYKYGGSKILSYPEED